MVSRRGVGSKDPDCAQRFARDRAGRRLGWCLGAGLAVRILTVRRGLRRTALGRGLGWCLGAGLAVRILTVRSVLRRTALGRGLGWRLGAGLAVRILTVRRGCEGPRWAAVGMVSRRGVGSKDPDCAQGFAKDRAGVRLRSRLGAGLAVRILTVRCVCEAPRGAGFWPRGSAGRRQATQRHLLDLRPLARANREEWVRSRKPCVCVLQINRHGRP
jgi:hypothetical protein